MQLQDLFKDPEVQEVWEGVRWVVGTLVAGVIAVWGVGKRVGKEKQANDQRYTVLRADVDLINVELKKCIRFDEHTEMQRLCRSDIDHIIDNKINHVVLDIRDELNVMNSNICRLMGAMNVQPIEQGGKSRRRTD